MFGNWVVAVFLRFSSNGAVEMQRLAAQTDAANARLLRQQGLIDANEAAMLRYQRRLAEVRAEQSRFGTMLAGGVALGGIATMAYAVQQAAQLQTALTTIKIATGATQAQMDQIREAAYNVSASTAQSVAQSARVLGVMAAAGVNNPKQLLQISMPIAKFADVQYLKSDGQVSFEDAARQGVQIAHLHQAYTAKAISPVLDRITKLSFMMPDSLNRYLTQAGYYAPLFRRMGVPEDQMDIIGAFLDRMGLGRGKGGTSLQDFVIQSMNALQQTAHVQSGHRAALERLGIIDAQGRNKFYTTDERGKTTFDLFRELQQINKSLDEQTKGLHGSALTAKRADFINDLLSAFKIQGARTGFLATPEGIQQLLNMVQQLGKMPGVNQAQGTYMNTLGGRFNQAVTNVRSDMTELGWPWIGNLTNLFKSIADGAHGFQIYLHKHKDVDHALGETFAILTSLATIRVAGGAVSGLLRIGGLLTGIGADLPILTKFGMLVDNVFFFGLGRKALPVLDRFAGAVLDLPGPLSAATLGIGAFIIKMNALAMVLGGTTSFADKNRELPLNMVQAFGGNEDKWLKFLHEHPGVLLPGQMATLQEQFPDIIARLNSMPAAHPWFDSKRFHQHVQQHLKPMQERIQHTSRVSVIERPAERGKQNGNVTNINVARIEVVLPAGTPKQHADMVLQSIMARGSRSTRLPLT